ncbi:MAG TPA: hypothetical protein VGB91_00660 [Rhizomicrobium sp.]
MISKISVVCLLSVFAVCVLPVRAQEKCFTAAGHLICAPGLQCFLAPTQVGPVPHCMPAGSKTCGDSVCSPSQICLSRTISGKTSSFCALPGTTVCGTGSCGAGYQCIASGSGHTCVEAGSKACGPSLRCSASQKCYSAPNPQAHMTMYHCAPPGSTVCGPSFVCNPGLRCATNTVGRETFYRCLAPGEH